MDLVRFYLVFSHHHNCMPHISRDLKLAAVRLHEGDLLTLPNILNSCNISRATFYHIWKLWQETGDVISHRNTSRQTRLLDGSNIQYLNQLIEENPDYFLDELLSLLKSNCFISVHYTTIHFVVVSATKNFNASPLNEMKIPVPTLLHAYPNMPPMNWASSMRFPRMNDRLADIMVDLAVGGRLGNLNRLFMISVLQLHMPVTFSCFIFGLIVSCCCIHVLCRLGQ